MALIVTNKKGLKLKGIGQEIEIAHGKELPEKILNAQFPYETDRFKAALIAGGHVIDDAAGSSEGPTKKEVFK